MINLKKNPTLRDTLKDEAVGIARHELDKWVASGLRKDNGGTGGDNARYGAVCLDENGKFVLKSQQHPCHAFMKHYKNPLVVFNQYGHRKGNIETKADECYFDWITSDTGPWKDFPNRLRTPLPEDYQKSVKDYIFDRGWIWTDLDIPANLQHSFLVASRMSAEWPVFINRWYDWVTKYDLDKAMAFVFLTLFKLDVSGHYVLNRTNHYDWPIDVCTSGEGYVQNFCRGKIEALIHEYSKNSQYIPVNRIFGENKLSSSATEAYPSRVFDLYAFKIGPSEEDVKKHYQIQGSGLTKFSLQTQWYVYEADVIEIIRQETKRLL